jgi:hypothetical protein
MIGQMRDSYLVEFILHSRVHWWGTLHLDEKMTWLPTWQDFFEKEFSEGQVSWATSKPRTRNLASREL